MNFSFRKFSVQKTCFIKIITLSYQSLVILHITLVKQQAKNRNKVSYSFSILGLGHLIWLIFLVLSVMSLKYTSKYLKHKYQL